MGDADTTIRLRLCNEPGATSRVRQAVERVARASNLTAEAIFDLKVAATEAVTNAIKGAPSNHAVEVAIAGGKNTVQVEVTDRGRFKPSYGPDTAREAEGGRGIPLMLALVDEVEFASFRNGTRVRLRRAS
jgi:serine/threonine-protein kinase RsbW